MGHEITRTGVGQATVRAAKLALMMGVAMPCILHGGVALAQSQTTPPAQPSITQPPTKATNADIAGEIVVTGSRIGQKAVTAQPIATLSGTDLSELGATNVGQELLRLPAFGVPANSTVGGQGSYSAGQTFVNLYDLGSQRTLTLVNGNRFVSSASSSIFGPVQGSPVDLGQIAPGLVDHIDVVSVGGAPIYGSDAIAGTVNVILKKNFQGVQMDASSGITQHGDAQDYNFSLLAGKNFAEGRGNITLDVYYDHQDGLTDASRFITGGSAPFFGQSATGNGQTYQLYNGGLHYPVFTNTGMPLTFDQIPIYAGAPYAGVPNPANANQVLYFNNAGHLVPFVDGTPQFNGITEAGGNGFSIGNYGNLLTASYRLQGTMLGHYDFSDHLHFHGEVWFAKDSAANLTDQPYYNTALFGPSGTPNGNLALSTTNPYLSGADAATINAAVNAANGTNSASNTFYMTRANTDLETGTFRSTTNLYRLVGGLDGDVALGTHHLDWEATVNYGHVSTSTTQRELDTQNFYNAIGTVTASNPNGIPCGPGITNSAAQTISGTCAPLDIFGVGNESQASLNYVTAIAQTHQVDTQFDFVADIKGDLAHLPGGDAKFVLGYENRRESQSFDPGAFYLGQPNGNGTYTQYGNSIPITPVAGSYHTNEGFGELNVPLISPAMGVPLIHSLDLQGAARYTDNSLTGGFWSYTGGGTYAPVAGITFRGNYTRSFRSPSVTELFAPEGSSFETANDPCDAAFITGGPNPATRAANCAKAGITQPFSSNVVNYTVEGQSGGSPKLQNERAYSWTAGVALQPKFIPGLSMTADYINIDIQNEITEAGLTNLMNACYDSSNFPNNPFCNNFTRGANGQVTSFTDNYINIADELFRGFQGELTYRLPLSRIGMPVSAGTLSFTANYLHTFKHDQQTGEGLPTQIVGNVANPSDSVSGSIDWAQKPFDWLWNVTYYGPSAVALNVAQGTYTPSTQPAYWMFDTSIGIKATENINFRVVINNVFNRGISSPYAFDSNREFEAIIGRSFKLNAQMKF